MSDPYEILGVQRGASEEEIKKAYKRLIRMENGIHLRIFLDNLVVITQMAELSKDRRQRQDMRRTRI